MGDGRFSRGELKRRLSEIETTIARMDEQSLCPADVHVLVYGRGAVGEVLLQNDKLINLSDVKNLILWVLADGSYLPWAFVKRKPLINKCVMIHMPGIDVELWEQHKDNDLKSLRQLFGSPITTIVNHPTTTAVQSAASLLRVQIKQKQKHRGSTTSRPKKQRKQHQYSPCNFEDLLAKPQDLLDYGFRTDCGSSISNQASGYVTTRSDIRRSKALVALDCEMCETVNGSELTRMSLVDSNGKVLVDTFVKPKICITDYRTPFSGITREILADVTTDLKQAQSMFCEHVSCDTIVVGHSLENDLAALKIVHRKVIDTSMIYPHPAGFPRRSSLRFLAKHFLGKVIQDGAHDSVMDARIALELASLKQKQGLEFGIPSQAPTQLEKLTKVLSERNLSCCMIDRVSVINKHSSSTTDAIPCSSDASVADKLVSQIGKQHRFIWAQFQDLYRLYVARNSSDSRPHGNEGSVESVLREMDATVRRVYDAAPVNTLIMISTAHGDTSSAIKAQSLKARREAGLDNLSQWTETEESDWAALSHRVVQGVFFAIVKGS